MFLCKCSYGFTRELEDDPSCAKETAQGYLDHFMKYKNYDRMHVEACKVFARYFYWDWPGEEKSNQIHPDSFYGSLIKSCFSAGYAQAKLDMKGDINE